jgi:hypothetical protein
MERTFGHPEEFAEILRHAGPVGMSVVAGTSFSYRDITA